MADKDAYKKAKAALARIEKKRRAICAPFDEQICVIEAAMEEALEPTEAAWKSAKERLQEVTGGFSPLAECQTCGQPIFSGEQHGYLEGGRYTCAEHAPLMSEVVARWEAKMKTDPSAWEEKFCTRAEFDTFIEACKAEIDNGGDWKVFNV